MTLSFLLCLITTSLFSQNILDYYPTNQTRYSGGNSAFYKDFKHVLITEELQPCENQEENINFPLVIYPDKTIKFVKPDPEDYAESKCTYDLTRNVLKFLKGWNPAVIKGQKVAASTIFIIIPNDLFGEITDDYDPLRDIIPATYTGGINVFRDQLSRGININSYNFSGIVRIEVTFVIERDGSLSNILLSRSSGLKYFDNMIIKSVSKVKNKWTPAKIKDKTIRFRFRLPLTFSSEA